MRTQYCTCIVNAARRVVIGVQTVGTWQHLQCLGCYSGLLPGLDHVVHLAQHVLEEHGLLAEALHAVQLLLVEVLQQLDGSMESALKRHERNQTAFAQIVPSGHHQQQC